MPIKQVEMERAHYVHRVDPQALVVDMTRNGRRFVPKAGDKAIQELVEALLREGKQINPCVVSKLPDGGLRLEQGYRRWMAIQVIREGSLVGEDHRLWKLEVVLGPKVDDKTSLLSNLAENVDRQELSVMDKASYAKRMVDEFGMTQKDVAGALKVDPSRISQLVKLMAVPLEVQKLVEAGKIAPASAYELADMDEAALAEYVARIKGGEKVSREQLRQTKADRATEGKGSKGGKTKPGPKAEARPRTGKVIAAELDEYTQLGEKETPTAVHTIMNCVIMYALGKRTASWLKRQMEEALE